MNTELVPAQTQDVILGEDLTADEKTLLAALLNRDVQIEVVIPDKVDDPEDLWRYLAVCVKAQTRLHQSISKIKPVIGRILLVIQNYPELYQRRGYKTFDQFMSKGVEQELGISRAEAYHAKRIAQTFSDVELPRASRIGVHKLSKIAGLVRENPAKREELLDYAENHSLDEVKGYVATQGQFAEGDLDTDTLVLTVPRSLKERWQEFVADPVIQGYVASGSPAAILELLMEECEIEWRRHQAENITVPILTAKAK